MNRFSLLMHLINHKSLDMTDPKEEIIVHSTSSGRLYLKDEEFFKNKKVVGLLKEMMESPLYKRIKDRNNSQSTLR